MGATTMASGRAARSLRVGVPIGAVVVVFALWWLSDRLVFVGPIDRATFGWGVVIPLWALLPVVAAIAWQDIDGRARVAAATLLGVAVSATGVAWFLPGLDQPRCEFGPMRAAIDWLAPVLIVASVIGVGLAVSSLAAARRWRDGHRVGAIVAGVGMQVGAIAFALLLAIVLFSGPACQRPAVGLA